jgi:hypothetical protein
MSYTAPINELNNFKAQAIAQIPQTLQKITEDLVALVHEQKIVGFSYESNEQYNKARFSAHYPIVINVWLGPGEVSLGSHKEVTKKNVDPELRDALTEMNTYLLGANEFLLKHLPLIKKSTFYTLAAYNKTDGLANEKIILLPEFMDIKEESHKVVNINFKVN